MISTGLALVASLPSTAEAKFRRTFRPCMYGESSDFSDDPLSATCTSALDRDLVSLMDLLGVVERLGADVWPWLWLCSLELRD